MTRTEELYGINPSDLIEMSYLDALGAKLEGGKNVLKQLIKEADTLTDQCDRLNNSYKQSEVYQAIQFTEALLEELEDGE